MPAYVKSVRYSDTPSSILLQQAQYAKQSQALLQKAAIDDDRARRVIPMGLADKLKNMDADVIQSDLTGAVESLSEMVRDSSIPTSEINAAAANMMANISQKSQVVKQFKAGVDESLKDIDKTFGLDKNKVRDYAAAWLAKNINDPSQLGSANDFLRRTLENPQEFVDRKEGVRTMQTIVAKAPRFSVGELVTVDATGNKKLVSGHEGKLAPWYRMKEVIDPVTKMKTFAPELKTSADGAIDETVFDQIYNYSEGPMDYRVRMTVNAGANDIIDENNKGKKPGDAGYLDRTDAGTFELAKRKYVTDFLKTMTAPEIKTRSTVDVAAPRVGRSGGGTGSGGASDVEYNRWKRISEKVAAPKNPGMGQQINLLEGGDQEYVLDRASDALGRKANAAEFDLVPGPNGDIMLRAASDLRDSDKRIIFKKGQPLATIQSQTTTVAEAKQVGGVKEAKRVAAQPAAPKTETLAEKMRKAKQGK